MKLFIFLSIVSVYVSANPLILHKWKNQCSFPAPGKKNISFNDEVFTIKRRSYTLHFNLCANISSEEYPECSGNKQICFIENNVEINVGTHFIVDPDNDFYLKSVGGLNDCKDDDVTFLGLTLSDNIKHPKLQPGEKDCCLEIYFPNPKTTPKCAFRIGNGELIDLGLLKSDISVKTADNRQFFMTLCGSDSRCDVGVGACEISDGKKNNLASVDTQLVTYSDDKKELSLRGTFGTSKKSKIRFYANLKCNWTVPDIYNASFNKKESNSKKFVFDMQSSYACIKLPLNCVVHDNGLTYNLGNFYNRSGYTKVLNTTSNILINVCGELKLPSTENVCSKNSSQICEIGNNEFINHGSVFNEVIVVENKMELTIQDGSTCKENPSLFYSTKIVFECNQIDEGPNFQRNSNCVTEILWKSPLACPHQEIRNCPPSANDKFQSIYNFSEISFDLTRLKRENGSFYTVKDKEDENIEFLFNVGAGLHLNEAPCFHNTMAVMRKKNETHLAKKFIPIGSRVRGELVDKQLELTLFGGYQSDYFVQCLSKVLFHCSNEEEMVLTEKNGCDFKFVWKSQAGCPKIRETCKFQYDNDVVRFNRIQNLILKFPSIDQQTNYSFSICKEKYQMCTKDNCIDVPLKDRHFTLVNGNPQLKFVLTNTSKCTNKTVDYNHVIYQFLCPATDFIGNDHIINYNVKNCDIFINISTDVVCSLKVATVAPKVEKSLKKQTLMQSTNKPLKNVINENEALPKTTRTPIVNNNCSLFNQNTGFTFSLNELKPSRVNISDRCPKTVFNLTNYTINLVYSTNSLCTKEKRYSYEILLNCTKLRVPLKSIKLSNCCEYLQLDDPDVCNLFKQSLTDVHIPGYSTGSIAALSTAIILLTLGVLLICVLLRKRIYSCDLKRRTFTNCTSLSYSYVKDGDF